MTLACGIDVGGTKIAGGVVDDDGTILEELRVESPATDTEAIEEAIEELVDRAASHGTRSTAVGVGAAGYIDKARSMVMFAPNIAWRDVDLKADLEARVDLPVVVENDANAAAWGEFTLRRRPRRRRPAAGHRRHRRRRRHRARRRAATAARSASAPRSATCGWCPTACCAAAATAAASSSTPAATPWSARPAPPLAPGRCSPESLLDRAGGDLERITGPLITEAARAGDPFAIEQLAALGRWLGEGIASLTAVLDPAVVVIGGGVGEAGDLLLDPVRAAFQAQLTGAGHRPGPRDPQGPARQPRRADRCRRPGPAMR